MADIKSSVIIYDINGNLLLQLRDEEPEINKWVLFGGSVEGDETEEEAARREIKEELKYKIKKMHFFKTYQNDKVKQPIFIVDNPVSLSELSLCEGSNLRFFSPKDIDSLNIGFNYKIILKDYLTLRNNPFF